MSYGLKEKHLLVRMRHGKLANEYHRSNREKSNWKKTANHLNNGSKGGVEKKIKTVLQCKTIDEIEARTQTMWRR